MKTLRLLLITCMPILALSQSTKPELKALFGQAEQLNRQALFTQSAEICETAIPSISKKREPLFWVDFITVHADNLTFLSRMDKAVPMLLEAKSIIGKKRYNNNTIQAKVLNKLANAYFQLGDCINMRQILEETLSLYEGKKPDNELAVAYDLFGGYWGDMGDTELASFYFKKARSARLQGLSNNSKVIAVASYLLAMTENFRGNYDRATEILQDGLDTLEMRNGNYFQKANLLLVLGRSYIGKRDFDTAIRYLEEGLQLVKPHIDDAYPRTVEFYSNIGSAYRYKGDFSKARDNFLTAINLLKKRPNRSTTSLEGSVLTNYAMLLANQGDFVVADSTLLEAYGKFTAKNNSDCNWHLTQSYQTQINRASFLSHQGEYKKAMPVYKKIIEDITRTSGKNSPYLTQPLNHLGLAYHSLSQFDSADIYYDLALNVLNRGNDNLFDFGTVISPIEYSYLIWNKAENFYYQYKATSDIGKLKDAFHHFDGYVRFLDYLRSSYRAEGSKVGFAAENKIAYERCIEIICELQRLEPDQMLYESAFTYLEKSKSLILLEAVKRSQAIRFANVPEHIYHKEDSLKTKVENAENRYYNYLGRFGETSEETAKAQSVLFAHKRDYYAFLDLLKEKHNRYYGLKYIPGIVSLGQTRKELLTDDNCIIGYFEGDYNIYLFFINRQDFEIIQIKRDFPLADQISDLRESIQKYYALPLEKKSDTLYAESIKQYVGASAELYQKLFAPVKKFTNGIQEIIIIPDGQLANIPFEALLSAIPKSVANFDSYPFLVRKHIFSYCYSVTMLKEMKYKKHRSTPSKSLLALAPFAITKDESSVTGREGFVALPYSREEVENIIEVWGGEYLLGQEASKKHFASLCGKYSLLHISTHGFADANDGANSFLAFSKPENAEKPANLYAKEIYNLSFNSNMVVLSACETNIGELQVGEGIISLARAFAYAGAKSILTTLWVVDDAATKDLTKEFYVELKKGKTKDRALHLAKRSHLKKNKNSRKHPFFWAAMIAVGDMSAIKD